MAAGWGLVVLVCAGVAVLTSAAVLCGLKGKPGLVVLGFVVLGGIVGSTRGVSPQSQLVVGTVLLLACWGSGAALAARPTSLWARWVYDEHQLDAAWARFSERPGNREQATRPYVGAARTSGPPPEVRWTLGALGLALLVACLGAGLVAVVGLAAALPFVVLAGAGRRSSRLGAALLVGLGGIGQLVADAPQGAAVALVVVHVLALIAGAGGAALLFRPRMNDRMI